MGVVSPFRHLDAFPNSHPHYLGNLSSAVSSARDAVREADLVVVLGDRLAEHTTMRYQLFPEGQSLIHVDSDEGVIGQNFPPELGILADCGLALADALAQPAPAANGGRAPWIAEYRKVYEASTVPGERESAATSLEQVMRDLKAHMPAETVFTGDSGLNARWVHRYLGFDAEDSFLAPCAGTMGYGFPAGVAAKLAHPGRPVVSTSGDGGFMMTGQELATAVQYGIKTTHILFNNSHLGTIRFNHEQQYPGRQMGSELQNPDFALLARAYGADGFKVTRNEEVLPAFQAAMASPKPALIEVVTDLEQITPDATLSEVRASAAGR